MGAEQGPLAGKKSLFEQMAASAAASHQAVPTSVSDRTRLRRGALPGTVTREWITKMAVDKVLNDEDELSHVGEPTHLA